MKLYALIVITLAGCVAASDAPAPVGESTAELSSSAGSPFFFNPGFDQYYACRGLATKTTADCNKVVDNNQKQLCLAIAQHSQTPCGPITNRDLQLSCYAMSVAPSFPSNCNSIVDPQLKLFCQAVGGKTSTPCASLTDHTTQLLCYAMTTASPFDCDAMASVDDRNFCKALASASNTSCDAMPSVCVRSSNLALRNPATAPGFGLVQNTACLRITGTPTCQGVVDQGHTDSLFIADYQYAADERNPNQPPTFIRVEDVCQDPNNSNFIAYPVCPAGSTIFEIHGTDQCALVVP